MQADLVLHCGERTQGFHLATLCVIDVACGWAELQPVWGITQEETRASRKEHWSQTLGNTVLRHVTPVR